MERKSVAYSSILSGGPELLEVGLGDGHRAVAEFPLNSENLL